MKVDRVLRQLREALSAEEDVEACIIGASFQRIPAAATPRCVYIYMCVCVCSCVCVLYFYPLILPATCLRLSLSVPTVTPYGTTRLNHVIFSIRGFER